MSDSIEPCRSNTPANSNTLGNRNIPASACASDSDAINRLQSIGAMYLRCGDLLPVLKASIEAAIAIGGADFGDIQLLKVSDGVQKISSHAGAPAAGRGIFDGTLASESCYRRQSDAFEALIIEDIEQSCDEWLSEQEEIYRQAGVRALVSIPVCSLTGDFLGAMSIYYKVTHKPSEQNLVQLHLLARQAGDILERHKTEAILHNRDEHLRAILDAASDAIISIDGRGTILSINKATEKMFGYTGEELIGRNVSILMPAHYAREHAGYLSRYLETRVPHVIGIGREAVAMRKDGTVFPIDLAVSEIDHMGQFMGIVRDISERKDLQRDILAIADEEQRRIGQDLHDSVQQELAAVGLLAQTLVNAIDRSPTVATSELMDLCRTLSKKIQSGLDRAHQEVRNISRGLVALPAEPTSLMDALCALANRTDGIRGVNCSFKCEAPVLIEDRMVATHLYRIAQEAVTNSLKHSEAKHILLELLSDAESFELKIADDGKGFHYDIKAGGLGIKTMRYRAGLIGGALLIMPIREGGTLVFCRFSKAGVNS